MQKAILSPTTRVLVLAVGFLILFIGGGARFATSVTLTEMTAEFEMGRGLPSLIVGLYFIVMAASMFVAGRLVDRTDARAVLAIGLAAAGIGIGLVSLATAAWQALILFGVVFAIGNGIASIAPVTVLVTRWFPERAGMANSIVVSGMSVGQLVMVAGMAAVLVALGWRSVYVWVGVAHLLMVPLVYALPRAEFSTKSTAQTQSAAPGSGPSLTLGQALRTRQFWLLLTVYAMCGFDDFFVSTHVVAFAEDRGIDKLFAGNLLGLMGLTALGGVFWAGAWSDRSGPYNPILACFLVRLASFILILVDQSPVSVAIFTLAFGITFLMTAPLTTIIVRNAFGLGHVGSISGLILMIHHMCGGVGALLGGLLFDRNGTYDTAFWVMLFSTFVAVILTQVLRLQPRAT
ncbi:MAG: MFS transporter [Hyphomicrobiaceae bacterium]